MKNAKEEAVQFLENLSKGRVMATLSEGTLAPYLGCVDVKSVKKFCKEREINEIRIADFCRKNEKNLDMVRTPWTQRVDLDLMRAWSQVYMDKPWEEVTEDEFREELYKIQDRVVYSRGDVDQIIKKNVKMDLTIGDAETRVLTYMAKLRKVIEEEGLSGLIHPDKNKNSKFCKLFIQHLAPAALKQDIMDHLEYDEYKSCRKRVKDLFELVVRRAVKQQKRHDYALRNGYKYVGTKRELDDKDDGNKNKNIKKKQKASYNKEKSGFEVRRHYQVEMSYERMPSMW